MNPEVWGIWSVLSIVVAGIVFALVRKRAARRSQRLWVTLLSAGATYAALSFYGMTARARSASVSIEQPPNGARVEGHLVRVHGVVEPADSVVTLIVRSESDERWWVQDIVHPDSRNGRWFIDAYLGTPTEGVRQSFTLIALSSNDGPFFRLITGRRLRRGMLLRTAPRWNRSPLHVVWRAR